MGLELREKRRESKKSGIKNEKKRGGGKRERGGEKKGKWKKKEQEEKWQDKERRKKRNPVTKHIMYSSQHRQTRLVTARLTQSTPGCDQKTIQQLRHKPVQTRLALVGYHISF